jgi:hypothetical protein
VSHHHFWLYRISTLWFQNFILLFYFCFTHKKAKYVCCCEVVPLWAYSLKSILLFPQYDVARRQRHNIIQVYIRLEIGSLAENETCLQIRNAYRSGCHSGISTQDKFIYTKTCFLTATEAVNQSGSGPVWDSVKRAMSAQQFASSPPVVTLSLYDGWSTLPTSVVRFSILTEHYFHASPFIFTTKTEQQIKQYIQKFIHYCLSLKIQNRIYFSFKFIC